MVPEARNYLERIEDLRGQVIDLLRGTPADALDWRPVEGDGDHATNSIAVLAAHAAGAEHFWIGEFVGGLPPTRDRDSEFKTRAGSADTLLSLLDRVAEETRGVLTRLTPESLSLSKLYKSRNIPIRFGILHVIDHTALHLGQMQLTLQLWQSGKAHGSPRWFERLAPGGNREEGL